MPTMFYVQGKHRVSFRWNADYGVPLQAQTLVGAPSEQQRSIWERWAMRCNEPNARLDGGDRTLELELRAAVAMKAELAADSDR